MAKKAGIPGRAMDAALRLAASSGWRDATMADIAAEAGVTLAQLHGAYGSKGAILDAFVDGIDAGVIAGTPADLADEPVRDRLFDILMRRFEALEPHRAAVAGVARAACGDPAAALGGACRLARSMRWMLECAGIGTSGIVGRMRVKGLIALYLDVMRTWMNDDSEDMAATMAALDRRLAQADRLVGMACRLRSSRPDDVTDESAGEAA